MPPTHYIVISYEGLLIESSDPSFIVNSAPLQNIAHYFPLIESVLSYLSAHPIGNTRMEYACVEHPSETLNGFYDFAFEPVYYHQKEHLYCTITDRTEHYTRHHTQQQLENENFIIHNS